MSFGDFKKINVNNSSTSAGTAILHSSLTNPLVGAGDFCRGFNTVPNQNISDEWRFDVSSSYNNGALINIPATKSISVRIALRHNNQFCFDNGVYAKSHYGSGAGWSGGSGDRKGYALMTNQNFLVFKKRGINGGQDTQILSNINVNTWYRIRLDVIPVAYQELVDGQFVTQQLKDIINCYTGSGPVGNEIWTLVHTEDIPVTSPYYLPWGSYDVPFAGIVTSSVGFNAFGDTYYARGSYVDRFEVRTENVEI